MKNIVGYRYAENIEQKQFSNPDLTAKEHSLRPTSYELDAQGVGVRVPVGSRIFFSPNCPDRL
jgi:hypothetical protein